MSYVGLLKDTGLETVDENIVNWSWKPILRRINNKVIYIYLYRSQIYREMSPRLDQDQLQHIAKPNINTNLTVTPLAIFVLRVRVSFMLGLAFARVRSNLRRVKIQIQPVTGFYLQQMYQQANFYLLCKPLGVS